jgi:hypothetical protein
LVVAAVVIVVLLFFGAGSSRVRVFLSVLVLVIGSVFRSGRR